MGGHLPVEISNRTGTLDKGDLMHSTKPLQLLKALFGTFESRLASSLEQVFPTIVKTRIETQKTSTLSSPRISASFVQFR